MSADIVYQNPWFEVVREGKWHHVHEPNAQNGAVIIAHRANQLLLVSVKRPAQQAELLELPRGYGQSLEDPQTAAARELLEETGFTVDASALTEIGTVRPNTAILSSKIKVFSCTIADNAKAVERDGEVNAVHWVSADELKRYMKSGMLSCGISLAALMLWQHNQ